MPQISQAFKIKNVFVAAVFSALSVISAFGQNTTTAVCTNETTEKISSRGIKIGADINDVLNLFAANEEERQQLRGGQARLDLKNAGFDYLGVYPKRTDERFEGISFYSFEFLDKKLVSFRVSYNKPKWKDAKQFAEKMAEFFSLPGIENWTAQSSSLVTIQCGDYGLSATINNENETPANTFSVLDNRTRQILERRKQKAEDEKREKDIKTFKP